MHICLMLEIYDIYNDFLIFPTHHALRMYIPDIAVNLSFT